MISNKVMYFDKRPEHIEKIFAECAKPEIDLCFYAPSWGRKGDLKDVECLLCHGGKVTRGNNRPGAQPEAHPVRGYRL